MDKLCNAREIGHLPSIDDDDVVTAVTLIKRPAIVFTVLLLLQRLLNGIGVPICVRSAQG